MTGMHFKSKIAQREPSDLGRGNHASVIFRCGINLLTSSGVCERRGGAASDDCRGFVDQLVVLKSLYHEQGIIHAARDVALKDGITDMPAPHR